MDNDMLELVSVIIPIYNVENYLAECLDSVLAQTHKNLEVICINDGSTDSSLEILHRYEATDPRVRVIDKPNAGYGNSVNCGLEVVTGEWVSIVEPDDLIHPRMYADLLSQAKTMDGAPADIVKGGYWLYFDLEEDKEPYIESSTLMEGMVTKRVEFTVREYPEVLRHHPSIWSALYRTDFLKEFSIRMTEPPGAGWADNPWFFRTMLQARSIVWVPASYYYYRQMNPNAYSKLNDYHMPFDRLRDIRAIYDELGVEEPELLAPLYLRTFSYAISTVLEASGFDESDPELEALIREAFESMDEDLVMSFGEKEGIVNKFKGYYRDIMGMRLQNLPEHKFVPSPRLSIVLPLHNDRAGLWDTIESLNAQTFGDFEVLCYDCDSADRSAHIVRDVMAKDVRFLLVGAKDGKHPSVTDAFNAGICGARGEFVLMLRSGVEFTSDAFARLIQYMEEYPRADYVTFGHVSVTRRSEQLDLYNEPARAVMSREYILRYMEATPTEVFSKLYRRSFLMGSQVQFTSPEDDEGNLFATEALLASHELVVAQDVNALCQNHRDIQVIAAKDEDGLIELQKRRLAPLSVAMTKTESNNTMAVTVLRCVVMEVLYVALKDLGKLKSGERYYDYLQSVWDAPDWSFAVCSKANGGCYETRKVLDQSFGSLYEVVLASARIDEAGRTVDMLAQRIEGIIESKSYKLSRTLTTTAKGLLGVPKRLITKRWPVLGEY